MSNDFMNTYLAHPERFYSFVNGFLTFKAQPSDAYYPLEQLKVWIENFLKKQ